MSNPFQSIPPRLRQVLYVAYGLLGLALAVAAVYGVDVARHVTALGIIGAAFGFTAASNVEPVPVEVEHGDPIPGTVLDDEPIGYDGHGSPVFRDCDQ